jgi:ER lumen protein retaining receptor
VLFLSEFRILTSIEIFWTFSIELESVCVLPQLQLLRQTSVPTVLDSYYLVMLGSYRFFYILNWIVRAASKEHYWEPVAFIFGVVQTVLYIDFAWVYYSRQRVKLRGGGVVDSDDLSKSFLVRRFISGRRSQDNNDDIAEEDEALAGQESGTIRPSAATARGGSNWGARGISVSADNTLDHHHHHTDIDASEIADPAAFEDETEDDDDDPIQNHKVSQQSPPAKQLKASGTTHHQSDLAATTSATANMSDDTANEWAAESNAGKDLGRD